MDCDSKMEPIGSPDREGGERDAGAEGGIEGMADCEGLKGGAEETDDSKKRKRKPYRPGKLVTKPMHQCWYHCNHKILICLTFFTRDWGLHGATKEVSHSDEERVFCSAGWRNYIRWTTN